MRVLRHWQYSSREVVAVFIMPMLVSARLAVLNHLHGDDAVGGFPRPRRSKPPSGWFFCSITASKLRAGRARPTAVVTMGAFFVYCPRSGHNAASLSSGGFCVTAQGDDGGGVLDLDLL